MNDGEGGSFTGRFPELVEICVDEIEFTSSFCSAVTHSNSIISFNNLKLSFSLLFSYAFFLFSFSPHKFFFFFFLAVFHDFLSPKLISSVKRDQGLLLMDPLTDVFFSKSGWI